MSDATQARYSLGAIILHWLIAIAVIANWRIAEYAEGRTDAEELAIMANHKALGIIILVLSVLRLGWRFTHKAPPLAESLAGWEKLLARVTHVIFYVLLIGLPIGGWLGVSYYGNAVDIFDLFSVPALPVSVNREAGEAVLDLHHEGAEILLLLIALHILGALKHSFYDKVPSLSRMWVSRRS